MATLALAQPLESPPQTPAPLRRRWGKLCIGLILLAALFGGREVYHVLFGANTHTVIAGRIYRGGQPTGQSLPGLVQRYGIKTVLNLRGFGGAFEWYQDEARACQGLGLAMEDVTFSAGRLPNAGELQRLVEILDRAEYPVFLHCRRGADRTSLAVTMALLLQTDMTIAEARGAMSLRYGHLALGRPAHLDEFFDLYEHWLADQGRTHDRKVFRHWLLHEYDGGWLRYRFEHWQPLQAELKVGQPAVFEVGIRNLGNRAWRITPFSTAGTHLWWRLFDAQDNEIYQSRGPMRDQSVAPGELLQATIVLPGLPRPGRYRLVVDMIEEYHCTFSQAGAEPREEELHVRE